MNYQTRHLEALKEISHGDRFIRPGEHFQATELDAEHYRATGQAKLASAPEAPVTNTRAIEAQPAARGRGRPSNASKAAAAQAPASPPAAAPAPAPAAAPATSSQWDRTEPMKLADVPHADADTPPGEA